MFGQSICLLLAIVQIISAQGPPNILNRECFRPPQNAEKPHECCKIKSFFKEEDFEECGFDKKLGESSKELRPGPPDCTRQNCLLSKYDLLKDGNPDVEKIKVFVTKWSEENPSFKDAAASAIEKCLKENLPGPPYLCLANKIAGCMSFRLFLQCPAENWESSAKCDSVKEHMEKCKSIFETPPQ